MDDAIRKAESLIEAGSYIRQFRDRLTVIKLGGSAMEDPVALEATLQDVVFMETVGLRPILVHGGGKAIDRAMAAAGLTPRKVQGRRVTDDATLEIVVRVLTQESEGLVEQIRQLGGQALPLFDRSLQCLFGERLTLPGADGRPIDLGRVGQVTRVDGALLESLGQGGVVPVIPSLAHDERRRLAQRQRRHRRRRRRRAPAGREARLSHRHARHPARPPRSVLAAEQSRRGALPAARSPRASSTPA